MIDKNNPHGYCEKREEKTCQVCNRTAIVYYMEDGSEQTIHRCSQNIGV